MEINYQKMNIVDKLYLRRKELYGKTPEERDIKERIEKGAVILDKPVKVTSHDLVIHIKKILGLRNASHVGTLDPKVSGVLPVLFNRSVKLNHYLSQKEKEYVVLMNIHKELEENKIISILKGFEGEIEQLPPKKSAVARRPRKKRVYSIELLEIDSNRYVLFKARVEAGTYIRALCRDFGRISGVGAHMQELRRIKSLNFDEKEAINFYDFYERAYLYVNYGKEDLLAEVITPIEEIVIRNFNIVYVKDEAASAIVYGAKLFPQGVVMHTQGIKKGEIIGAFTLKNELVGLMTSTEDFNKHTFNTSQPIAKPLRILIRPEEMPKLWKK